MRMAGARLEARESARLTAIAAVARREGTHGSARLLQRQFRRQLSIPSATKVSGYRAVPLRFCRFSPVVRIMVEHGD
jgi:hypothetical protein